MGTFAVGKQLDGDPCARVTYATVTGVLSAARGRCPPLSSRGNAQLGRWMAVLVLLCGRRGRGEGVEKKSRLSLNAGRIRWNQNRLPSHSHVPARCFSPLALLQSRPSSGHRIHNYATTLGRCRSPGRKCCIPHPLAASYHHLSCSGISEPIPHSKQR